GPEQRRAMLRRPRRRRGALAPDRRRRRSPRHPLRRSCDGSSCRCRRHLRPRRRCGAPRCRSRLLPTMRRMLLTGRTIRLTGDDGTMADRLVAHGATLDDDGAVAVHVVSVSTVEQPLAETNGADWAERCDAPILAAIDAAQEAHRRHASKLVFVVPVLGMT